MTDADLRRDRDIQEEDRIRSRGVLAASDGRYTLSLRLLTVMSGMGGVEFSAVLPSLWQYIQRITPAYEDGWWTEIHVQLVAMVAFYTATMLVKPTVGLLIDSGVTFRTCLRVATFCGGAGGLLYALAGDVGETLGVPMLLCARFVGGGGNAMSTIANVYAVKAIRDPETKSQQLALFAAATLVGIFVGPSIVPLFARIDVSFGPVRLDECTLPGWFLFCVFGMLEALQEAHVLEPPASSASASSPLDSAPSAPSSPSSPFSKAATEAADAGGTAGGGSRYWIVALGLIFALTCVYSVGMFSIISVLAVFTEEAWG